MARGPQFVTKPGKHGTLRQYEIEYNDPIDPAFTGGRWRVFAYDMDHAVDMFYESNDGESWRPQKIAPVRTDVGRHRWGWKT